MQIYYYINAKGKKDGPHDIVTIMKRIRSGIILPNTQISHTQEEFVAAHTIEDLSLFFNRPYADIRKELVGTSKIKIIFSQIMGKGWQFTLDHPYMPAFSGSVLLISALVGILVNEISHNIYSAVATSWIIFLLLQNCFFAVSLRLYRGQKVDNSFIEHTLAPIMGKVAFVSVIFSLLLPVGFALFIIPATFIMLICAYMPMFILDYDYGIFKTIRLICSMLAKIDFGSMCKLALLTLSYMISIALIIPIPIIMPIIAGSLCAIYEEASSS